ncbi:MAG: type VI secretion system-associated FHA domain protein TagH [Woeseia sp.]
MSLKLTITSTHKELVGEDQVREFAGTGGTIGRSLENDWILPDPDRFISGKHATVDFRRGAWYLADVSSNGVYVNKDIEPLGRGNPRRLFNGDHLRMGDFEFDVSIDEGEGLDVQSHVLSLVPEGVGGQMVPESPQKTGIQLLDEEEITGDEAFRSTLFGSGSKPAASSVTPSPMKPSPTRQRAGNSGVAAPAAPPAQRESRSPAKRVPRDAGDMTAEQLFEEFLGALGIARDEIHPAIDMSDVMQNAGKVLRELVSGFADLMISRTNVKTMFRLDQTTVLPHHNNPLKLSENINDSLKQLLIGRDGEYLGPQDSVREVCRDLKFHHDAVIEAMTASVRDFTERFDPAELQESFERSGTRKSLIDAFGKMKFWNLYCDLYPELADAGDGQLPLQFGEEFVRNYEKRIADYKRVDRKDSEAA